MNKKKILALVLARKNSTRLKNKNILILKNKPLINWTLDFLKKKKINKYFTDVFVSTDSLKINKISRKYNFLSPWLRPKKLSGRYSSSATTALHALKWYEKNVQKVDGLFLFQPTSPFRKEKKIVEAINLFVKYKKQIVSITSKKTAKFKKGQVNGSLYLTPTEILKKKKTFNYKGFFKIKMASQKENIDIDTIDDFNNAKKYV